MALQHTEYPLDYCKGPATPPNDTRRTEAAEVVRDVDHTADGAPELAAELAADDWLARADETAKQIRSFLEQAVRERPMATMAGAMAIAFCMGAVLRRNLVRRANWASFRPGALCSLGRFRQWKQL